LRLPASRCAAASTALPVRTNPPFDALGLPAGGSRRYSFREWLPSVYGPCMPKQALVSLIMPVWRPEPAWLHAAVRSALDQRGCDLELVVVDDGNDVPVRKLLSDLSDVRLRHVRIAHSGVSAARNAGTAVARGQFLRYVDADDVLDLGSTSRLLARATAGTVAYESTLVCDQDLVPGRTLSSRLAGDVAVPCLLGQFESRVVSMLFPAEVVRAAGPWDTGLEVMEDWDFVLRCVELALVSGGGEDVATFYRRHAASATREAGVRARAEHGGRRVLEKYLDRHPEVRGTRLERDARHVLLRDQASAELHGGSARRFLSAALVLTLAAPWVALPLWVQVLRRTVRSARRLRRSLTGIGP